MVTIWPLFPQVSWDLYYCRFILELLIVGIVLGTVDIIEYFVFLHYHDKYLTKRSKPLVYGMVDSLFCYEVMPLGLYLVSATVFLATDVFKLMSMTEVFWTKKETTIN